MRRSPNGRSPEMRFWEKVQKTDTCWIWTAACNSQGYGQMGVGRHLEYAHRFSWALHRGPIPDGLFVCHHCDNPLCVRPDHLFLGTAKDNAQDMLAKGRARNRVYFGAEHWTARAGRQRTPEERKALQREYHQQWWALNGPSVNERRRKTRPSRAKV